MAIRRQVNNVSRLVTALRELDGVRGKTGWFETAKYTDGTPVAYVATIQEFGSGPIPPRPFMRPTVAEQKDVWLGLLGDGAKRVLSGGATASQVMEAVALKAAGDVAKTISRIQTPPLSILTLMARASKGAVTGKTLGKFERELYKGPPNLGAVSRKPLVWTGQMIQSVTGVVEKVG